MPKEYTATHAAVKQRAEEPREPCEVCLLWSLQARCGGEGLKKHHGWGAGMMEYTWRAGTMSPFPMEKSEQKVDRCLQIS